MLTIFVGDEKPMEFSETRPIYLQIREHICERILTGEWRPMERIPSVRDMALLTGVAPNTVVRSYESLYDDGIIFNRRGLGFFVREDAVQKIKSMKKSEFMEDEIPSMFRKMGLLGIPFDELQRLYSEYSDLDR